MKYWINKINQEKFTILGVGFSAFVIWRFNVNFDAYEKAIKHERIFDVKKANQQLRLYREIYDPINDIEKSSRLIDAASTEDKTKLKEIFKKYEEMDETLIEEEIIRLKEEVDLLEERKTNHQGIKLARIYYGYEPSEAALKKIRENYIHKRNSNKNE